MRVRVVLPAPLRPTRPTLSPGPTRKETSCISNRAPARTSSLWALIIRLVSLGRPRPPPDGGPTMRFNPKARLDTSRMRDHSGGGGGGGMGGLGGSGTRVPLPGGTKAGGGLGLVLIIVVLLVLKACAGVDLIGAGGASEAGYDTSRFTGDSAAYDGCQ